MTKLDRNRNHGMPSPMFFNDKDMTGKYANKSALRNTKNNK